MLAICFVIVYFSLLIIQTVRISGGFIFASDKISRFYFKFTSKPYLFRFRKSKTREISLLHQSRWTGSPYLFRLIDLFILIKYGFNHLKKTFRDLDIKKSQGLLLSPSNIKAIVRYHLKDLITACNLPGIKSAIFIDMLIPLFNRTIYSYSSLNGNNYSFCRSESGKNINPLLVYTMRLNCNFENSLNRS